MSVKSSIFENKSKLSSGKLFEQYSMSIALVGLIIVMSFLAEQFFTVTNLLNILRQMSIMSVVAIGMTYVILSGNIDLSVGSLMALYGCLTALFMNNGMSYGFAILITVLISLGVGAGEGYFISKFKIPSFVVTLGMMSIARGAAYAMTFGYPIFVKVPGFLSIGRGNLIGIPMPAFIVIILLFLSYIILNWTLFGRNIYAIGGSLTAAKLAGINLVSSNSAIFAISSLASAIAGIIMTARLTSAQPSGGMGIEMQAIAAVVLGGTPLSGGRGGIGGTIIGILIIAILSNGLDLLNVISYWKMIIEGTVLVLAVLAASRLEKKQ